MGLASSIFVKLPEHNEQDYALEWKGHHEKMPVGWWINLVGNYGPSDIGTCKSLA